MERSNKQDHRHSRILIIDGDHVVIVQDESWTGMNLYGVTDLDLLVQWWNQAIRFAGDQLTREIKDRRLKDFHAALWIRINELHPIFKLRFSDITQPELLKKIIA